MAEFNFEAAVKEQENANVVKNDAITTAKENIEKRKAEEQAREAELPFAQFMILLYLSAIFQNNSHEIPNRNTELQPNYRR